MNAALKQVFEAKRKAARDEAWYAWHSRLMKGEILVHRTFVQFFRAESKVVVPIIRRARLDEGVKIAAGPAGPPASFLFYDLQGETAEDLKRQIEKKLKANSQSWAAKIYRTMKAGGGGVAQSVAVSLDFTFPGFPKATETWLARYVPKLADQMNKTSLRGIMHKVAEGVADGKTMPEIADDIEKSYQGWSRSRPYLIARTETNRVAQIVQQDILDESGFPKNAFIQTWLTARDKRVRDTEAASHVDLEGVQARRGDNFIDRSGKDTGLKFPLDPSGSAAQTIQCRCTIAIERIKAEPGAPALKRRKPKIKPQVGPTIEKPAPGLVPEETDTFAKFEWTPITDALAGRKQLQKHFQYVDLSWATIPPEVQNDIVPRLVELLKAYKIDPQTILLQTTKAQSGEQVWAGVSGFSKNQIELNLRRDGDVGFGIFSRNSEGGTVTYYQSTLTGWHPNVMGKSGHQTIIEHEFAHILQATVRSAEALETARLTKPDLSVAAKISGYAKYSVSEMEAEAWVMYLHGDRSEPVMTALHELLHLLKESGRTV